MFRRAARLHVPELFFLPEADRFVKVGGDDFAEIDPMTDTIIWQFPLEIPVIDLAIRPDARRVVMA